MRIRQGWIPKWLMRLIDFLTGSETYRALQCKVCGQVFEMTGYATEGEAYAHVEVHLRLFHGITT